MRGRRQIEWLFARATRGLGRPSLDVRSESRSDLSSPKNIDLGKVVETIRGVTAPAGIRLIDMNLEQN